MGVTFYKYLSLWMDEKLSFKLHVEELTGKLKQRICFQKQMCLLLSLAKITSIKNLICSRLW